MLMLDLLHLNRYVDRHFYQNEYPWVLKQAEGDIDMDLLQVGDSQEFLYI